LGAADDPVKGVQLWAVNNSILVPQQHLLAIIKGVDDDSSSVA
jgi:hypothetical protein